MADQVIASLVGRLSFEVDAKGLQEFGKHLGKAEEESKKAGGRFGDLDSKLGELATGFAKRLPAAIATGVAALGAVAVAIGTKVTASFIESGAELDKWARKMGTTTQELQRLEFAGTAVGAEADNTREAIKTLRENLGELERVGSGPAVDSLATLGLTLGDLQGKDAADQLGVMADAMQRLPNDAQRVSVALEIMGEDGGALLPLFQKGSKGIDELAAKADRLGIVLDDSAIEAAKNAKVAFGELTAQATGLANQIGAKLAPKVTEVIGRIQGWYEANRDVIDQKIDRFIEGVVPVLERLGEVAGKVVDVGSSLVDMFGGLENALVAGGAAAGIFAIAMGGIPGIMAAATAAIALGINELAGFSAEVRQLQREIDDSEARVSRAKGGVAVAERLDALRVEGKLGDMTPEQLRRDLESVTAGLVAGGASEAQVERTLAGFEEAHERQRSFVLAESRKQEGIRAERSQRMGAARELEPELRRRLKKRNPRASEQAIEAAVGKYRMAITEGSDTGTAAKAAAASLDSTTGRGGKTKVDTRAAEAQLGTQIRALAQGVGATTKATEKAIEAAAQSLKGGAAQSVALGAATSTLESLTGQKLAAAGGPDAALFGMLTEIGGASAARTATEGARFVRIDQSVNIDVGGIDLVIPEEWAGAMAERGAAPAISEALRQLVVDQVFAPIVERAQARGERP